MPPGYRKMNSIIKSSLVLCLAVLFFPQNTLLAQVISNNGAVMSVTSGAVITTKDLSNGAGTVSNNGTITLSGNYKNAATTNGNGTINIAGNWTNTGTFTPGTGTVNFNGSTDQTITKAGGETFFNLNINNSGVSPSNFLQLSNDVTVSGTLTMTLGNIDAGVYKLILSNPSPASLNYTLGSGSRVLGKFERGINIAGTYLFPIGTLANYNPLNLITNVIPAAGSVISEFIAGDPGDNGLPKMDGTVEVADAYTDGYWSLTANNGFSCGDYSLSLDGSGFLTPVFNDTRIMKRPAGGDWLFDGTHSDAIGTVCYRNNLTGDIFASGTQFSLGKSGPKITSQPSDRSVCIGSNVSFSVVATGYPSLTYQWYKAPNTPLIEGGRFSGTNLATLNITNVVPGDAGNYYCKITDGHGRFTLSYAALLTVNLLPAITLDLVSPVCNTDNSFSLPYTGTTNSPITYSIIAGTPAMPGFVAVTDVAFPVSPVLVTIPTGVAENTYQFIITVKNANGCVSSTYPFTVTVYENQIAAAGSDQAVCGLPLSAILEGNTPPKGTGTWTIVSGPGNVVFTPNPNTAGATITADTYGTYLLRWTIVNGTCSSTDDVTIGFVETANAGSDQAICGVLNSVMTGNTPTIGSGSWSVFSKSAGSTVTFGTPSSASSTINVDQYGTYILRWTVTNPTGTGCSTTDDVTIGFVETANAGSDQAICGVLNSVMAGNTPTIGSGSWSVFSKPAGSTVTFGTPSSASSTINVDQYGTYILRWTVTNPTGTGCSTTDDVTIGFVETANAGSDQAICGVLNSVMTGNTPTIGSGSWSVFSKPVGSTVTFGTPSSASSTINVDKYGTYILRWTVTNPTGTGCSTTDDVTIGFSEAANAGSDQAICGVLTTVLAGNTPTIGSGLWTVITKPTGSTVTITDNTNPLSAISVDNYGTYILRWTLTNISGTATCNTFSDVEIWFEPTPAISASDEIICNNTFTNILPTTLTSPRYGVRYVWNVSDPSGLIIGEMPSVGNGYKIGRAIKQSLNNTGDTPNEIIYTLTPYTIFADSSLHCIGNPIDIHVWVEPTPQATIVTTTPIVCNGSNISVTINSPTVTTTSADLSYVVAVTSTDAAHLGGTASIGFTKVKTDLPFTFIGTLTNSSDAFITVTYTVTPKLNGCSDGPPQSVIVKVEPTPQAIIVTTTPIVCNGSNISVTINSPTVTTTSADLSYVVAVTSTDAAHLGGTASTGFTKVKTDLPFTFIGTLTNSSDVPITVTYTVTPKLNGCSDGPPQSVIVKVEPTPQATIVTTTPIVCNGNNINVTINSPTVTTTSANLSYVVAVTSTDAAHLGGTASIGFTKVKTDLPFTIIGTLTNSGDAFITVTYTVTPKLNGCSDGTPKTVTVKVNPTPRVIPVNISSLKPDSSICSGGTTAIKLTTPTVMTSGGIIFDYSVSVTGSGVVVGNTSPGVNRTPGYIIAFPYQDNSDTIQSVYYTITPKVDNAICVPGNIVVSEIKLHARPLQSIVVTKPLTCSGGAGLAALRAVISKGANPYQVVWDGPVGYHKVDSLAIANLSSGKYVIKVTDNLGCNRKDSISIVPVTARAYISADVIPPGNYNISCIGSTDGTILVSVTGGITPPYNYWVIKNDLDTLYSGIFTNNLIPSDPTTYRYYNNLGAGSYTLLIQDVNGCLNINRIVFRVPPPIVSVFSKSSHAGYNISCKGYNNGYASVQTSGGRGGYTYTWYTFNGNIPGPVNTDRIDNLIAGTYFLETKDVLGCPKIDSTVVTEPDGLQLSSYQLSESADGNFNISCYGGNDGSITMTISGGSGNNVYFWTGPAGFTATTKDLTGLKAGGYTCLVRDQNGCVLIPSPSFTLTEPSALVMSPPVTSFSTDGAYNINCYGSNTGWINITVSGGSIGTYKYNWSTSNGSGIINGQKDQTLLTAGTYNLVVTDSNKCVITKDITLTQPPVFITQLTPTNITCKSPGFNNGSINLAVTGGVAPYSYLWSNGKVTKDIAGLTPGNYTVTVTDFNGCIKKDSARVDLPPNLNYTKNLSDYNGYGISCNGLANGFIHVDPTTGSAPFVYTWTGPDGFTSATKNISNLIAGQYQLLIVDSNECKASGTFDLTEPGKFGFTFTLPSSTAGGFNINCAGESTGSIDIDPVNQVKTVDYLWADGIFGKTRTDLPAGNYSVIIIDANNCHASSTITITEPDSMKLIFNILSPFCPDKPDGSIGTDVTGGVKGAVYSYRWSDNSSNSNLVNIPEGYYKVTVTDMNGCSIRDSVNVKPINEACLVIPNAISPNGDLINDVWNIGMKELYPSMEVIIFNRWGETIWRSERGYPRPWDGTSNGSSLPIDSYHYIIDLHNGSRPLIGNVTIVR